MHPKYGLVVPQLLSPPTGQTYPLMHQVGSHDVRLEWNRGKSILEVQEEVRLHRLKLQFQNWKNTILNVFQKL